MVNKKVIFENISEFLNGNVFSVKGRLNYWIRIIILFLLLGLAFLIAIETSYINDPFKKMISTIIILIAFLSGIMHCVLFVLKDYTI